VKSRARAMAKEAESAFVAVLMMDSLEDMVSISVDSVLERLLRILVSRNLGDDDGSTC
jgi:hypothetical protein